MKGPLHQRLRTLLRDATARGLCTQESLARAMGKTQTSVGAYLREVKGGALDLDEAAAALDHIGGNLSDFIAGIPTKALTSTERLVRELQSRDGLEAFLQDLLRVPRSRLSAVLDLARTGVYAATGRRATQSSERPHGPAPEGRTTRGPKKRR